MTGKHELDDSFDLNLLRVLDALLTSKSVTIASQALGMTQSGTSRALQRLREQFEDPILVREGQRMVPTAIGEQLRVPVSRLLQDSKQLILAGRAFEPRSALWAVRIAQADYVEHLLMPCILEILREEAPGICVHSLPPLSNSQDRLMTNEIDFIIDHTGQLDGPNIVSRKLFSDTMCCALSASHPFAKNKRITLNRFASSEHIVIAPSGIPQDGVDVILQQQGMKRKVRAQVASFAASMPLVETSQSMVILPKRLASQLAKKWNVALKPAPVDFEMISFGVYWLARERTNPAHRWFRDVLCRVSDGLDAHMPG
ncbi:MAG: LysR family transcriptional regulator [Myxococcota bacterium]